MAYRETNVPATLDRSPSSAQAKAAWEVAVGRGMNISRGDVAALLKAARDAAELTRLVVVDHRSGDGDRGRIFDQNDASIDYAFQDGGRTLKVFVSDRRT